VLRDDIDWMRFQGEEIPSPNLDTPLDVRHLVRSRSNIINGDRRPINSDDLPTTLRESDCVTPSSTPGR
jgi:hypothetical protein